MAGFEYAIAGLKSGQKVARAKWKNVRFIFLCKSGIQVRQVSLKNKFGLGTAEYNKTKVDVVGNVANFVAAVTDDWCIYPWVPSQEDMISEDWFEVNMREV